MNFPAFLNTITTRNYSLPLVILYVTAGCNLRCIMCSYREALPNELTLDEIKNLAKSLSQLGLRHIVYSGGEPLIRRDLPEICHLFQKQNVKQSLLTNGLLLEKRYEELKPFLSEIILSIDGPSAEIHNSIRGIEAFDLIVKGLKKITASQPRPKLSIRTVVQRKNFRHLDKMVELAKSLGVDRISFLAADVFSAAFHRDRVGEVADRSEIALNREEVVEFRELIGKFISQYTMEIQQHFISESTEKLFHIVQYFEALVGKAPFPRNHCNAPMVSAVITSTGDLLPCYFLPAVGNIRSAEVETLLNNSQIRQTRKDVRAYSLQRCHECVCTLKVGPVAALMDRF